MSSLVNSWEEKRDEHEAAAEAALAHGAISIPGRTRTMYATEANAHATMALYYELQVQYDRSGDA